MTVGDLIECGEYLEDMEIVVRENGSGKWIQGYRCGKEVELYRYEERMENREAHKKHGIGYKEPPLKSGEDVEISKPGNLPMRVIKKSLSSIPDEIKNLKVRYYIPRHIWYLNKDPMTHITHSMEVNCYPEGFIPPKEEKKVVQDDLDENGQLKGQMSFL